MKGLKQRRILAALICAGIMSGAYAPVTYAAGTIEATGTSGAAAGELTFNTSDIVTSISIAGVQLTGSTGTGAINTGASTVASTISGVTLTSGAISATGTISTTSTDASTISGVTLTDGDVAATSLTIGSYGITSTGVTTLGATTADATTVDSLTIGTTSYGITSTGVTTLGATTADSLTITGTTTLDSLAITGTNSGFDTDGNLTVGTSADNFTVAAATGDVTGGTYNGVTIETTGISGTAAINTGTSTATSTISNITLTDGALGSVTNIDGAAISGTTSTTGLTISGVTLDNDTISAGAGAFTVSAVGDTTVNSLEIGTTVFGISSAGVVTGADGSTLGTVEFNGNSIYSSNSVTDELVVENVTLSNGTISNGATNFNVDADGVVTVGDTATVGAAYSSVSSTDVSITDPDDSTSRISLSDVGQVSTMDSELLNSNNGSTARNTVMSGLNNEASIRRREIARLDGELDGVGASAAALAGLNPLEYDPDNKFSVAAAYGSYDGSSAVALGAFYRPNENVMVNFGASMGSGENLFTVGVAFALDKNPNYGKSTKRAMLQNIKTLQMENGKIANDMGSIQMKNKELAKQNAALNARLDAIEKMLAKKN